MTPEYARAHRESENKDLQLISTKSCDTDEYEYNVV